MYMRLIYHKAQSPNDGNPFLAAAVPCESLFIAPTTDSSHRLQIHSSRFVAPTTVSGSPTAPAADSPLSKPVKAPVCSVVSTGEYPPPPHRDESSRRQSTHHTAGRLSRPPAPGVLCVSPESRSPRYGRPHPAG